MTKNNYSDSIFHSLLDDNSNQSSIADSSPVKQENSCSTSPTPEVTTVSHRENSEAKTDQSPDSKRGEKLQYYQSSPHWQPAGGIVAASLIRWMMSHFLLLFFPSNLVSVL